MSQDPRRFVQPNVPDARVERLWQGVSAGLEQRRGFGVRGWVAVGAIAGAAAGALVWWQASPRQSSAGVAVAAPLLANEAKLETGAEPLRVALVDGSAIELAPRSALRVQGNQSTTSTLTLASGAVTCDVTHREGRRFSVLAGDVEVRVVGTRFTVKRSLEPDAAVEVSVVRGVVEVVSARHPGEVTRVAAGQSFREIAAAAGEAAAAPGAAAARGAAGSVLPATPAASTAAAQLAPVAPAAPSSSSGAASVAARELFEKAGERRRSGDAAGAAAAYEELLRLHPSDGRAGLSAFELGRLRMDRLGDSAGAISALERALSLNVGPTFREDALARLVSIYAAQGNFAACAKARDRYLASYPAGVHAAAVTSRCGSR